MKLITVVFLLGSSLLFGCENRSPAPEPEVAASPEVETTQVVASPQPVVDVGPCVSRSISKLPGVQIQFLMGTRCAFSVEELQKGITIPYQVIVTTPHRIVPQAQDPGECGRPGPGGLTTFVEIGDGLEQRWCSCDQDQCSPFEGETTLEFGAHKGRIEWDGRTWGGSKSSAGALFEPGDYTVRISATGKVAGENKGFEVEAELPILVTKGPAPRRVLTTPARPVDAPIADWAGFSDAGSAPSLNDRHLLAPDLGLFIVVDGSPGDSSGALIAERTKRVLRDRFASGGRELVEAVEQANAEIHASVGLDERKKGAGASMAAVATTGTPSKLAIAHVGTSRVYRLRSGTLEPLTRDHLLSDDLINSGEMKSEDLESFPYKGVASRAVGARRSVEVGLTEVDYLPGDTFLLTTQAFHEAVELPKIAQILVETIDLSAAAQKLRKRYKHVSDKDNIAVVLFRMDG